MQQPGRQQGNEMKELSKSQRARSAIAAFKTIADALILRGSYHPSGTTGSKLEHALRLIQPEIYGSMADDRIVELKGLEYVIDRLPRGIEACSKIIMTAQEDLDATSFEAIIPRKRRRLSYAVSDREMCFVVTRGTSEIYDILTHLTFLNIEAKKIGRQAYSANQLTSQWQALGEAIDNGGSPQGEKLDKALWNLSIILGRTYRETKATYEYLETNRTEGFNNGLLNIVYALGRRIVAEQHGDDDPLIISFTPSLQDILGHHQYAAAWARSLRGRLVQLGLENRPIHLISANLHSIKNILYGRCALEEAGLPVPDDLYEMVHHIREQQIDSGSYGGRFGFIEHKDTSGSNIDVQIIDMTQLGPDCFHPALSIDIEAIKQKKPVILVIDYAFGTQAYEIMDELLSPAEIDDHTVALRIASISIMGKAGILPGNKGDIMLATAHVMEGTPHNYILSNDLTPADFSGQAQVYCGPMLTVMGTSLQNRDVLKRFSDSSWKAVGLEMEGGHYQRAINAAIIQGYIPRDMKVRYAYYASDNPLISGHTLASGPMGPEGVAPTYLISRVILEKILAGNEG
jgi:hypothetical protein